MADNGSDITRRDSEFLAAMTDDERKQWIKETVNRMMVAWQVPSKTALAAKLDLNPKAPSSWIQNLTIPYSAIFLCHFKTGHSLGWLYNGTKRKLKITPPAYQEISELVDEVLVLGQRMELINEVNPNGIGQLTNTLLRDLTALLEKQAETQGEIE